MITLYTSATTIIIIKLALLVIMTHVYSVIISSTHSLISTPVYSLIILPVHTTAQWANLRGQKISIFIFIFSINVSKFSQVLGSAVASYIYI